METGSKTTDCYPFPLHLSTAGDFKNRLRPLVKFQPVRLVNFIPVSTQYFKALRDEMANGGTAALFHYLLQRDISQWHPRMIPHHILERGWEMKIMSAGSVVRWWFEMLQQGYLWQADYYSEDAQYVWPDRAKRERVVDCYLGYCNRYKITHPEHSSVMGRVLSSFGFRTSRPSDKMGGRYLEYLIPSLEEARDTFSKRWGIPRSFWAAHEVGDAYA